MVRPAGSLMLCAAAMLAAGASALAAQGAGAGGEARGRALYAARCTACHGPRMTGTEEGPALIGAQFVAKWRNRPANLFAKIKRSMPQDDPGTLSAAQAADLLTALSEANHGRLAPSARLNQGEMP